MEMNLANADQLAEFRAFHVQEIAYSLFNWVSGSFEFRPGSDPAGGSNLKLALPGLIFEAIRLPVLKPGNLLGVKKMAAAADVSGSGEPTSRDVVQEIRFSIPNGASAAGAAARLATQAASATRGANRIGQGRGPNLRREGLPVTATPL